MTSTQASSDTAKLAQAFLRLRNVRAFQSGAKAAATQRKLERMLADHPEIAGAIR